MLLSWLLAPLALLGALDALYFVAVTYRWMAPDTRWVPAFCRMEDATCARIVDTKWARLFGLPNAVYGLAWYMVVGAVGVYAWGGDPIPWCLPLLLASAATVLVSLVLFWSIVWRMRTRCPLCFFGHAINIAIFGVLLAACL